MDSMLAWVNMPMSTWFACSAVLLLGAFVQRATGFGLAIIGAPLHEVRLDSIGMALVGRLPGNALGIWLLLAAPMFVLEKLIAVIVLFAVLVTLCRFQLPVNRITLFGAGVLSGIFGTVAAIGGPPIVLLMHGLPADRVRGNLAIAHRLDRRLLQGASLALCTLAALGLLW